MLFHSSCLILRPDSVFITTINFIKEEPSDDILSLSLSLTLSLPISSVHLTVQAVGFSQE